MEVFLIFYTFNTNCSNVWDTLPVIFIDVCDTYCDVMLMSVMSDCPVMWNFQSCTVM